MINRETRIVTFDNYLAAARGLEAGWLYHEDVWAKVMRDGFGVETGGVITIDQTGTVVAATPLFTRRKFGVRMAGSPMRGLFTEFAGPLFAPKITSAPDRVAILVEQHRALQRAAHGYIEWGVRSSDVSQCPSLLTEIVRQGGIYSPRPTLVVDLTAGAEVVWNRFEGRARNMIRKAEKQQVSAGDEMPDGQAFEEVVDLVEATFTRQGIAPPHPRSAYLAMARHLAPAKAIRFVAARFEGRLVAGGIFLVWGDRMMYLSGASTEEGNKLAASSLIQWTVIKGAISAGIKTYDLGGVGIASIDKFKASFGGGSEVHHRCVSISPLLRLAFKGAEALTRLGVIRLNR